MSRLHDDGITAPLAALHNCGPGPRAVFHTPSIGRIQRFDIEEALRAWKRPAGGPAPRESAAPPSGAVPPSTIASLTAAVLADLRVRTVSLDPAAPPAGEAKRLLGVLVETLLERGSLDDLIGIAFHEIRTSSHGGSRSPGVSTLALARTLAVYAVYAPPLLLWGRSPSLRWMRRDTLIAVRRFDPAGGPEGDS